MTKPLSPAAQAVLDALPGAPHLQMVNRAYAAAALRAAADQVEHHWDGMECVDHLQAIAAELEDHHG